MTEILIPDEVSPQPVKNFLKSQGFSTNYWKKAKFSGTFRCNGELISHPARLMIKGGDLISWELSEHTDIIPEAIPISISYEDDFLLSVDKPAGQLVHPTGHEVTGTLANAVLGYYQGKGFSYAYHPIHRLDRNTTGLLLIAKQAYIHHQLSPKGKKLFHREYIALVSGIMEEKKGTIDSPIARDLTSIIKRKVSAEGSPAITHFKVIAEFNNMSLLWIRLETGRTHQIRVHLSSIGHPLIGDDLYGGNHELLSRQALHAAHISFFHPVTKKTVNIFSPIPKDITFLLPKNLQETLFCEISKNI